MTACPRCGRLGGDHGMILFSGGPEALPEDTGKAAEKARKLTPVVRDASEPVGPSVPRAGTGTTARRRTAKEAAQVSAWRKLADQQKGKRA